MTEAIPPIFIWEPGDLAILASVAGVSSHLEPLDVKDATYTAYDSQGRRLRLGVDKVRRRVLGFSVFVERVVVHDVEESPEYRQELHEILVKFLGRLGEKTSTLDSLSLRELQDVALRHVKLLE